MWVLLGKCLLQCVFKTLNMSALHLLYGKGDIIQRGAGEAGRRVMELTCDQKVHSAKGKVYLVHYQLISTEVINVSLSPKVSPRSSNREEPAGQVHEVIHHSPY